MQNRLVGWVAAIVLFGGVLVVFIGAYLYYPSMYADPGPTVAHEGIWILDRLKHAILCVIASYIPLMIIFWVVVSTFEKALQKKSCWLKNTSQKTENSMEKNEGCASSVHRFRYVLRGTSK
jgi:hypothetical protein